MMETTIRSLLINLEQKITGGECLEPKEALYLYEHMTWPDLPSLFEVSAHLRKMSFGNEVRFCAITNAKSGYCTEDCIFCSQSLHHQAKTASYPLLSADQLLVKAGQAEAMGAHCFSLVTSGGETESPKEIEVLCQAIEKIKKNFPSLSCAASLGMVSRQTMKTLKEAGLERYHHNLETARSFFTKVCTTHTFEQRQKTIESAKEVGLQVCSGGIFGLGESPQQRLELAFILRDLAVDSIPLNFLHPIAGTKCEGKTPLAPLEALKTIALYRLIFPKTNIHLCGGRQMTFRALQSWIFLAGADGLMVGNYLTTQGCPWEEDQTMIRDLGLMVNRKPS